MSNRIITGDSHDPWRNLAVEALLFESPVPEGTILYLWQNADTVVIGRHQNAWQECRVKLLEDEGGRLARRSTGGGAVFHDLGNLNFSFVTPRERYDAHRQLEVIRRAAAAFGIQAEFTGRNDLLAGGAKFSGSAYRFDRAAGLHHGTLLIRSDLDRLGRYLNPDPDKLKAKGIRSVRARVCNLSELNPEITVEGMRAALMDAFVEAFGPAEPMAVSDLDTARLGALEAVYASWDFRLGKAMPFDARLSKRFPWGGVTLELSLRHGAVASARVWSDAMDDAMIDLIAPAIVGARYENSALAGALSGVRHPRIDDIAEWIRGEEL